MKRHLALLLPLLLCAGCGGANPFRAVERSIQAELPRLIGPADHYQVRVSRSGASLVAGRIPWIEIEGRSVRAIEGLDLDELRVRLDEVRFSRGDHQVREIGSTRFQARISAAAVTRFVHRRGPILRDVEVRFVPGGVQVHGARPLLGISVPFEIEGTPVLRGMTTIDFDASRIAILRLGLPEFAVQRIEARLNPLIDLAALPLPLRLAAVRIEGDHAIVSGTAALTPANFQHGGGGKP